VIERVGRRLASTIGRSAGEPAATPVVDPDASSSVIEFLAYGDDCLLIGRLRLYGDRLTDLLNDRDEFEIVDIVAERLSDGHAEQAPALTVTRDDLLLVQAAGPRGDPGRRLRTRAYPIAAQVGPYRIGGQLHAMPGVDPALVIHRRGPMVPLTDAWVERPIGTDRDVHRIGTVVLNRDRMDWVVATWDDSSGRLDDAPRWLDDAAMLRLGSTAEG
jgi:hypothetical protein